MPVVRTLTVRVVGDIGAFQSSMQRAGAEIVKTQQTAQRASVALNQMRGGMAALANAAIGQAVPGLGAFGGALSTLIGSSGPIVVGIGLLAGLALAMRQFGRESQGAAGRIGDILKMQQQFGRTPLMDRQDELKRITNELIAAKENLRRVEGGSFVADPRSGLSTLVVNQKSIANAKAQVDLLTQALLRQVQIIQQMSAAQADPAKPYRAIAVAAAQATVSVAALQRTMGVVPIAGYNPFEFLAQGQQGAAARAAAGLRNVSPILGGSRNQGTPPGMSGMMRAQNAAGIASQFLPGMLGGAASSFAGGGLLGLGGFAAQQLFSFLGSQRDQEERAYRAHLRALREDRDANRPVVNIIVDGVSKSNSAFQELIIGTIREAGGTRVGGTLPAER